MVHCGKLISVSDVHPEKALEPILVHPSNIAVLRFVQPENKFVSIEVVLGKLTFTNCVLGEFGNNEVRIALVKVVL